MTMTMWSEESGVERSCQGTSPGLPLQDPRLILTRILGHVRTQWRELSGGKEHPFHAGNLSDAHGASLRVGAMER